MIELLLAGLSNAEIAQRLHLAERTIKSHFNNLFDYFEIMEGHKRVKLAVAFSQPVVRQALQIEN